MEGKRVSITVFLKMLVREERIHHELVECPEDFGEIGSHVSSSDDVAHILRSSKNDPVAFVVRQTVVSPHCECPFTSLPATGNLPNVSSF